MSKPVSTAASLFVIGGGSILLWGLIGVAAVGPSMIGGGSRAAADAVPATETAALEKTGAEANAMPSITAATAEPGEPAPRAHMSAGAEPATAEPDAVPGAEVLPKEQHHAAMRHRQAAAHHGRSARRLAPWQSYPNYAAWRQPFVTAGSGWGGGQFGPSPYSESGGG